jgi:hypothetical protein
MSGVTFSAPASTNFSVRTSYTLTLPSVGLGDPIVLVHYNITNNAVYLGASPITDTFTTPYLWTLVVRDFYGPDDFAEIWIGTGGSGSSGTVTVTNPSNSGRGVFVCWRVYCVRTRGR